MPGTEQNFIYKHASYDARAKTCIPYRIFTLCMNTMHSDITPLLYERFIQSQQMTCINTRYEISKGINFISAIWDANLGN